MSGETPTDLECKVLKMLSAGDCPQMKILKKIRELIIRRKGMAAEMRPRFSFQTSRIGLCALQRTPDLQHELFAQTRTLPFIPASGFNIFHARRRFENGRTTHFQPNRSLSSASTCSNGIPSSGLARKSARRPSSSAACSGVKSGSRSSSAINSQNSCASLIRSSRGRALAASRISDALMVQFYSHLTARQAANIGWMASESSADHSFQPSLQNRGIARTVFAHGRLLSRSGSSAQICSHETPFSGLRLNRSARRSASSSCSEVKPSLNNPNSSNTRWATSRRSSSGKRRICSRISVALMAVTYRDALNLQSNSSFPPPPWLRRTSILSP